MHIPQRLILGSKSPRRAKLLEDLGLEFEVIGREVDEIPPSSLLPRAIAVFLSEHKAKAYNDLAKDHVIITADTIVVHEGELLGKPANAADAVEMLERLAGNTHEVITGVTIFHKGRFTSFSEITKVSFRELSKPEISFYVDQYKPFDKAGAYGIQEWMGMVGVEKIEGDYYNVVGLPVGRVYQELKSLGLSLYK